MIYVRPATFDPLDCWSGLNGQQIFIHLTDPPTMNALIELHVSDFNRRLTWRDLTVPQVKFSLWESL